MRPCNVVGALVSTLAGGGSADAAAGAAEHGFVDGVRGAARFHEPRGIALGGRGGAFLYVADSKVGGGVSD